MKPTFCIAIVTRNNWSLTKRCLDYVYQSTDRDKMEVIVVDNASTDETRDRLVEYADPSIGLLLKDKNVGVGVAYNEAFSYCHAPFFVTLNNDLFVKNPEFLRVMVAEFNRDPLMAAVGVRGGCTDINDEGLGCGDGELEYVEGSLMMVRVPIVRNLREGLFDTVYRFGYFEDSDLSLRLRKRGFHIGLVDLEIEHIRAATSRQVIAEGLDMDGFHLANQQIFLNRWGTYLRRRKFDTHISIRRTGARGDMLFMTPILREIKRRNAFAKITVFTDVPDVLEGNVNVDCQRSSDLFEEQRTYDKAIDLDEAYERRMDKHIIQAYAEVCGIEVNDWRMEVHPGKEAEQWAEQKLGPWKWAAIHPHVGQISYGRNPGKKLLQEVAESLLAMGWKVVLMGTHRVEGIPCDMDLQGETEFRQAAAVVAKSELFFGVDGALMNVAQARMIPTVGIFGAREPRNVMLPYPFVKALTAPMERVGCLGCHNLYAVRSLLPLGKCMRETDICMERITTESAMEAIRQVLGG